MHPLGERQYVCDRMTFSHKRSRHGLNLLRHSKPGSATTCTADHGLNPLPFQPTYPGNHERCLRPTILRRVSPLPREGRCRPPFGPGQPVGQRTNPALPLLPSTAYSERFQNLSTAQRNRLFCYACDSNGRIVLDSVQEGAHETRDRTWRRWSYFCDDVGVVDPLLHDLSTDEQELVLRAFHVCLRVSEFTKTGFVSGIRKKPMVVSTLRGATSALAAAFRDHIKSSPLHLEDRVRMLPSIRALLRAFNNISPPEARQKAVTPKLLCRLWRFSAASTRADLYDHAVDLVIGAFFFAMRPCEFVKTPLQGRTRIAQLRCIVFQDRRKNVIPHTDPRLTERAEYVTVIFEDQKNKTKNDARTQRRTGDPILCPVLRFCRAVQRVITTVPDSDGNTPLCSLQLSSGWTTFVDSTFTRNLLRYTCKIYGGKPTFGFSPE
jgi:hypothetical protein